VIDPVKERQHPVDGVQETAAVFLASKAMGRFTDELGQEVVLNEALAQRIDDGPSAGKAVMSQFLNAFDGKTGAFDKVNELITLIETLMVCPDAGKGPSSNWPTKQTLCHSVDGIIPAWIVTMGHSDGQDRSRLHHSPDLAQPRLIIVEMLQDLRYHHPINALRGIPHALNITHDQKDPLLGQVALSVAEHLLLPVDAEQTTGGVEL